MPFLLPQTNKNIAGAKSPPNEKPLTEPDKRFFYFILFWPRISMFFGHRHFLFFDCHKNIKYV